MCSQTLLISLFALVMTVSRARVIEAALEAGRKAAAEKLGSQFDISNNAHRGAYVRRIREAMAGKLTRHPNLGTYTDTHLDRLEDLSEEEGFEIGVFDRSARTVTQSAFIKFENVDFVLGSGPEAMT